MRGQSFQYDGIARIEVLISSAQKEQSFPATTTLDTKQIVGIEAFTLGATATGYSPGGKSILGTTTTTASDTTYLQLIDANNVLIIDKYPMSMMENRQDRGAVLEFKTPIKVNFADSKLHLGNTAYVTTGEVAIFYFYYINK